ncbi:MAG TPA: glycosyltransferase family 39 protein [Anaerolineae bacterium]|nr:glycosyltransferase family 39 protein [Anaerolineae bacterium]
MKNDRTRLIHWLSNHWVQLGVVLVVAALLRFINLATIPQGIFHDEAWSAAKALDLLNGTAPAQVYFPENNGMDALHVYLIALLFKFTGPLALGSRIISALMGTLSVLATYWLAWELPADDRKRHTAAISAALIYSIMLTAIATSRSGWHSPSFALLALSCLAALMRARRLGRRRWFVVAGVLAGLAQYTYPSARLLPVWLIVIGLLDLALRRGSRRRVLFNYLLAALAAAIIFLPLGMYFIQDPQWLVERAQQTSSAIDLGQNTLKTLLAFVVQGSLENLHNLPGRPLLDPVLGLFFIIGLGVCAIKHRAAHVILLSGVAILSLAVVLTEAAPLTRRWTAVLPLVAIIAALGLVGVMNWITARWPTRRGQWSATLLAGAVIFVGAGWSITDYFGSYVANPQLFWEYDSGITQVADQMRGQPATRFFLTPYDRFYEVIRLTLAEQPREPIQSYNGMACALFPAKTDRVTEWLVVTEKDQQTLPLLKRIYPAGRIVWRLDSPVGTYARAWQVPAGETADFKLDQTVAANFGDRAQLIGVDLPATVKPGDSVKLRMAFEDRQVFDQPYKVFVHVRGSDNTVLAQADRVLCDTSLNEADWRPGDILVDNYDLTVPAETPPGDYPIVIGFYQETTGARLPVIATDLEHAGDSVTIGMLHVR